jgi:hypothetical protein
VQGGGAGRVSAPQRHRRHAATPSGPSATGATMMTTTARMTATTHPAGIVVQLVRALPCQGGSCGFDGADEDGGANGIRGHAYEVTVGYYAYFSLVLFKFILTC